MHQTYSIPININKTHDSIVSISDSSRLRKRKLSFPASFDYSESKKIMKKRKKEVVIFDDNFSTMDRDFSIDLNLPEVSTPNTGNEDVFEWMENMLGKRDDESSTSTPTTDEMSANSTIGNTSNENEIDSFLTLNESDPCYEEMISLLAEGESVDNNEDNLFKQIHQSFIYDHLSEQHSCPSTPSRPSGSYSKTLKRSSSFSRRPRSSRISIRQGIDQLVKANRLTAKTRFMLLNCKPSFNKNNSQ